MGFHCARARFYSLIRSIFEKRNTARELPPKALDIIHRFLSTPDQICFALTYRTIYNHYLLFIKARYARPLPLLRTEKRPILDRVTGIEHRLRSWLILQQALLVRLENSRWRYCSGCWKLHQPSAWRPPSLSWHSNKKPSCMPYAGKVELCPCLTLTFPDALHLLNTTTVSTPFRHECDFTAHPLSDVSIISTFGWNKTGEKVIVKSRYIFRVSLEGFSPKKLMFLGIKTPLLTSRKNIKCWLQQFFDEAGSSFTGWRKTCSVDASLSHCNTKEGGKRDSRLRFLEIIIERNLGSGKWTDRNWKRNCCSKRKPEKRRFSAVEIEQEPPPSYQSQVHETLPISSLPYITVSQMVEEEQQAWSCY